MNREQAISQQVKGFLVPEFTMKLPNGQTLNGLTERGMEMIKDGYACGECLATFDHYTVVCPICGLSRDVMADVQEAPQLWLDHIAERENPGEHFVPATFEEAMIARQDFNEIPRKKT